MITLKTIAAISQNSTKWDEGKGAVTGFGARRQKGDAVAYVVKYRTADGRQRWATIGRHGAPWTPEMARDEARRILGKWRRAATRRARSEKRVRLPTSPNCATPTLKAVERDAS